MDRPVSNDYESSDDGPDIFTVNGNDEEVESSYDEITTTPSSSNVVPVPSRKSDRSRKQPDYCGRNVKNIKPTS